MSRRLIAVLVVASGAVFFAPNAAQAAFGIEKWSAITCNANSDTPEVKPQPEPLNPPVTGNPPPPDPNSATRRTPEQMVHPGRRPSELRRSPSSSLNRLTAPGAERVPRRLRQGHHRRHPRRAERQPRGAAAVPGRETRDQLLPGCQALVGVNYFTVALEGPPCAVCPPAGECLLGRVARAGLQPGAVLRRSLDGRLPDDQRRRPCIVGSLDPVDQHVTFTISDIHAPPAAPAVVGSRLVFNGRAGDGTYLTMPSNCTGGRPDLDRADGPARRRPASSSKNRSRPRSARPAARTCPSTRRSRRSPRANSSTRRRPHRSKSGSRSTRTRRSPTRT